MDQPATPPDPAPDFDAESLPRIGEIIDGKASIQAMGQRIFELVLATASGEPSKSERHGYGQNEFVPWQVGAVM